MIESRPVTASSCFSSTAMQKPTEDSSKSTMSASLAVTFLPSAYALAPHCTRAAAEGGRRMPRRLALIRRLIQALKVLSQHFSTPSWHRAVQLNAGSSSNKTTFQQRHNTHGGMSELGRLRGIRPTWRVWHDPDHSHALAQSTLQGLQRDACSYRDLRCTARTQQATAWHPRGHLQVQRTQGDRRRPARGAAAQGICCRQACTACWRPKLTTRCSDVTWGASDCSTSVIACGLVHSRMTELN